MYARRKEMKLTILKKSLSAGLAAVLLFMLCSAAFAEIQTVYLGDANRDGTISAGDARQILRFSVGLDSPDLDDLTICDTDGDGAIGSYDARTVLRVVVGMDSLSGKIVTVGEAEYEPEPEPEPVVDEPEYYPPEPAGYVDPYEQEILAIVICQEVGGESEELQLLVANVVINRVNSPYFPDTVYGVLTQPWQYERVTREGGIYWPSWADEGVKNQCRTAAYRVLSGERFMPEDVVFQASFYQGSGVWRYYTTAWDDIIFCYI